MDVEERGFFFEVKIGCLIISFLFFMEAMGDSVNDCSNN